MKQEIATETMILLTDTLQKLLHPPKNQFERRDAFVKIIKDLINELYGILAIVNNERD
jgi:hypothetical protein